MKAVKNHSETFADAGMRNSVPILLAIGSALLGSTLLWMSIKSRPYLPSFLFGPGVVGVVFCVLEVFACVACFIAIRSGEGYHSKRSTVDPTSNEMRRTHIVKGWGLKYVVSIVGGGMFVAVGSFLYMAFWVMRQKDNDFCLTFSSGENVCGASTAYTICFALGLLVLAMINVAMEGVVAAVEARFEVKRDAHAVEYARRKQNGGLSSAGIGDPLLPSYCDQPSMSSYRKSAGVGYYDS